LEGLLAEVGLEVTMEGVSKPVELLEEST